VVSDADRVVDARGVTKWYGEATALDRVDLQVDAGTVHGLLGPNGAGKTTLLSVLFGLVRPDEGTVELFGRTRTGAGSDWLAGVGGFVETPRFYPYLSGRKNLEILARLDGGDAVDLIADLLELVGIGEAGGQKVRGYSLGMRQRLGLAAALLRRPRLLILDEPTNGMDPAGIRDLREALRRLADGGLTVILSSHDMAQVEEICDAVTVLARGTVAFTGRLDRMRADAPDPSWRIRTSDDPAALRAAAAAPGPPGASAAGRLRVVADAGGGLLAHADQAALDAWVVALGRAGIAVRALALDVTPLEALFFRLTEYQPTAGDPTAGDPTAADPTAADPTAADPTAADPSPGGVTGRPLTEERA
jgi:ABC-2 type transport system ATP-binding protein